MDVASYSFTVGKSLEEVHPCIVAAYLPVERGLLLHEVDFLHPTYPGSGHDGGVAIFLLQNTLQQL